MVTFLTLEKRQLERCVLSLRPFNSVSKLLDFFVSVIFFLQFHISLQILISPDLSNLTKEVKRAAY